MSESKCKCGECKETICRWHGQKLKGYINKDGKTEY